MKSILLHVYDDTGFESRLQAALDLARAFEGHITCLHATPFEDYLEVDPWVAARLPEEFSDKMKALRLELQARIEQRLRIEGANWDWMHLDSLISNALIRHSILSDVVVVTLAGQAIERHEPRPLAAAVATGGRAPVLAVPEGWERLDTSAPAVLAWNGTPEAAAAMRAAVPLLQLASSVHMVEVQEKPARYPRDLAARYLSRHDVHVQILERQPIDGDVTAAVRAAAEELGAGLLVMGAFGHSRVREFFLGGMTHDLISGSPIPLLLAH